MEESGHYYTVYFTSLAVGFKKNIAYRHALLAQMPDEVGFLDAAEVHKTQCNPIGRLTNLSGKQVAPSNEWRFAVEYVIHSLPDRYRNGQTQSSAFQRSVTVKMLRNNKADSLEFGLLLHRLGDTYAHSVMDHEEKMYTTTSSGATLECLKPDSVGHARHVVDFSHGSHDPDYPFLRPALFYDYLDSLYEILAAKHAEKESMLMRDKRTVLTKAQVKSIFTGLLGPRLLGTAVKMELSTNWILKTFIYKIREACERSMGIKMESYQPELNEKLETLAEFLKAHDDMLGPLQINEKKIKDAIADMSNSL